MGFDEFMKACLYDPEHGFFATGPLRSSQSGDFLTSPEVSPLFGATLARFVAAEWERLGRPADFAVVDVGAGSGSLLAALLEAIDAPVTAWAVEASPAARAALREIVEPDHVFESVDDLGGITGVVIANELLDNVPAGLAVWSGEEWLERKVGLDDAGRFEFVDVAADGMIAAWASKYGGELPPGSLVETQPAAATWLRTALAKLDRGAFVAFDYGGTTEELAPRRTRGTLRTYRAHHLGPDPLDEPGETDVTVDVNFSALVDVAEAAGHSATLVRQDDFLTEWGLRDVVTDLRRAELEAARSGPAMERLAIRSRLGDAEALLHPRGLGDFRVLVVRV